ncbi:MAG: glycosyltransferase family 39 protein [Isosphaeraceae bacterium]
MQPRSGHAKPLGAGAICVAIVALGAGLRSFELGRLSFWYDEVVTMRLARAGSPGALVDRLFQIDATRAPLHPLLLQAWLEVFRTSEASARSLSVVCGVATIVLVFLIGRIVFDAPTGLWAAWLGALSPILIVYAREARMYAWLVLVTCCAWLALLALLRARSPARTMAYGLSLVALAYSHPLGLVMGATLALAGLIGARACFGGFSRWLFVHLAALVLVLPWIGNYFDHPPEFLSGRLPLRFLLGVPIGFIGGDFRVLGGLLLLIVAGLLRHTRGRDIGREEQSALRYWSGPAFLLLWFALPPLSLYLYSLVSYPIFGPARYTACSAPAFLVLVAAGLRSMPALVRYPVAGLMTLVSALALGPLAYDPELKADWRAFALEVSQALRDRPGDRIVVIVASSEAARNVEVETARYYLPASCTVIPVRDATPTRLDAHGAELVYFAVGLRRGEPAATAPERLGGYEFREPKRYPGLIVYRGSR